MSLQKDTLSQLQQQWLPVYELINEDFCEHIKRPNSLPVKNYWDFHLERAKSPKMIGLKLRGIYGKVQIYFDRQKQKESFPTLRSNFEFLLKQNGYIQNGNVWLSKEDSLKLKYDGSLSFSLDCPEKKTDEMYAQWQVKGLILLAQLLEKLYGVTPETKHNAPPDKPNTQGPQNTKGKDKSSRTGNRDNGDNTTKPTQTTDIDPRQWRKADEIENMTDYPVKENLQKIYEIGEYEVAYRPNFPYEGPVYYLTMENTDYVHGKRHPRLDKNLPRNKRITQKQLACWPMRAGKSRKKDIYQYVPKSKDSKSYYLPKFTSYPEYKMSVYGKEENFHFPDGSGVEKPMLHPQVIFLGKNWSDTGNAGNLEALWSNGYCDQANVLLDSILSGGYFTDFIKCFLATNFDKKDKSYINTNKPLDGVTWLDVYVNLFIQEIYLLNQKFSLPDNGHRYIIIWGSGVYELLNDLSMNSKHHCDFETLINKECDRCAISEYTVLVFGNHYSNVSVFPDDKRYKEPAKQTCRRVYRVTGNYDDSMMKKDRSTHDSDLRRYEFALIEDKDGKLHAYKGNPPITSN